MGKSNSNKAQMDSSRQEKLFSHPPFQKFFTDAIRPDSLEFTPEEGYRNDTIQFRGRKTPLVIAAVSREKLWDVFLESVERMNMEINVVLETSHHHPHGRYDDIIVDDVDNPVFRSTLVLDYEDLLMNDGHAGIAVADESADSEIQFDGHKRLIVYGGFRHEFKKILESYKIPMRKNLCAVAEVKHIHLSSDTYHQHFLELVAQLQGTQNAEILGEEESW